MEEISNKEKDVLMQAVYACAANGLERESLDMITKACNYAMNGKKEEALYASFVSDMLDKMANDYKKKITII